MRYADGAQSSGDPCSDNRDWGNDNDEQHCEVRDESMAPGRSRSMRVQTAASPVEGWDRNEIKVQAIVRTNARTEARARELGGRRAVARRRRPVSATGPETTHREWWSVSYRINVPRRNDLDLNA